MTWLRFLLARTFGGFVVNEPLADPRPDRLTRWTRVRFSWTLERGWQLKEEADPGARGRFFSPSQARNIE